MIPPEWIDQAATRIAVHIRRTSLTNDPKLNIYFKWENHQVTGSFKVRGALNKILALKEWEQQAGLVSASAGNHGQGVALAGRLVGASVIIFVPRHAISVKIEAMRAMGAEINLVDGGYDLAEVTAIRFAAENHMTWISAYNDGQVIAGQGTIGLEIAEDLPLTSNITVLVPVGGGGMIAGIGAAFERFRPHPRLVGVQADASAFMHRLYHGGMQEGVPDLPTLADGLSGAVEEDSLSIPMIKNTVDDILLVSEDDIAFAIAYAWHNYNERIEGSAAVTLAAVLSGRVSPPAVAIISGGNIQPDVHVEICSRFAETG